MDEDDSQDEMINRNVSHGKGKRPAMSIVSDDEENSEDGGSETDSEEEELLDGEDEEDEDEDDSGDEDSEKVLEGAAGNVPVDSVDLSSDEDSEKCPICLNSFHQQPIATPEACEHYFCLDCILEWSQNANSCPVDRKDFSKILLRTCYGGNIQKTIAVQKPIRPGQEEQVDLELDQTSCEVCGGRDREDRLLLCDGCDAGYHMECLTPPLDAVPVEEWFCPECIASNRSSGSDQVSEEDSSSRPTTSRSRSRPTRAIARTQHSERVRANVNRHRITQARTASQLAPRYLMQSTWLDETINAVVAGLNTAVYVRDLTPHPRSTRRRKRTAKRRKTKGKLSQKTASGGNTHLGVKRRKRKTRRSKSRRKPRETNSRSRIARSLGITKHSSVPTVYRPMENSLGSMRAEIGAASLSVYGDPFDLDPFDDREDEIQVSTPPSVLDAKRRVLSRSALRSHQPVARPITAGLSRHGGSLQQMDGAEAEAPVSDLLGSILSGQSLLLMDSSDVVINRDGSLKATKPVSLPSCTTPRGSSSGETTDTPNSETGSLYRNGEAGPSSSPLRKPPSAHGSPGYCSTPQNPTSPCSPRHSPHFHYPHPSSTGHPRLHPGPPSRSNTLNSQRPGDGLSSTSGIGGQPVSKSSNKSPELQDKAVKKLPPRPVWEGVATLPRIPKIKKEGTSSPNGTSGGSSSNSLPDSSLTSLAGNTGRERSVDQQGTSNSQTSRNTDAQRQRSDRTSASSTFSSSFTSSSSSFGASSNSRPSSSSISFRINSSGNPWHARRLPASGGTPPGNSEETVKKNDKSKRMLLSLKSQAKEVKSEVYDPFNPTGSDSSDTEPENEGSDVSTQNTESWMPTGTDVDACHQIKPEPVDVEMESSSEICAEVKEEQQSFRDKKSSFQIQAPSGGLVVGSSSCGAGKDADEGGTSVSLFTKTEDRSESTLSCSGNVKIEVKSEAGDSPVRPQSKSLEEVFSLNLPQSSKSTRVGKELPPASGPSNPSHMAKIKEERSKDAHNKKLSRSKDRRSRSTSRDRQQRDGQSSRSRSKDRKRPRSRERRRSSSSSSRERKTSRKRPSHEKSDSRGRERQSKSAKERRRSRSRSFSRSSSRERRRTSKNHVEISNRHKSRSRSTSRERKRHEERSENSLRSAKSSCKTEPKCRELNEPTLSTNKTTTPLKMEKDGSVKKSTSTASIPSVKQEVHQVRSPAYGLESSSHDDQTRTLAESKKDVSLELKMLKPEEIKQEKSWPTGAAETKQVKDIKKEEELNLCEEHDAGKDIKNEDIFSKESSEWNEMKLDSPGLGKSQACYPNDATGMVKNIKIEQIWPDEDQGSPCCSDNPLVISLDTPDTDSEICRTEEPHQSPSLTEQVEMTPAQPLEPVKQEPVHSSDEDNSVDYLIDNLDFIKKEMNESSVSSSADAAEPKPAFEEDPAEKKPVAEPVTAGVKSKSQGKRVTWNLQEPEGPQSEKLSKIALFKLKLKQEGSRRSSAAQQTFSQDKTQAEPKLTANVSSPLSQDESVRTTSHKDVSHDPHQKEKYMKKLHMQERAIEEVKLSIKPFYQRRDITKDEYKEILRKAVQKVCHSKSGEINPVKVANLVKAYVDKYKHARKHKKEESGQRQPTDASDLQTSA